MDIKEALGQLDTLNDEQWTGDGAPRVDAVEAILGEDVTRAQIIEVAPEFSRENPVLPDDEEASNDEETSEEQPSEDEVADTAAIEEYLEGEPLSEQEFAQFLKTVPANSLDVLEAALVEQMSEAEAAISRAVEIKNRVKRSLAFTRSRIKREVPDVSNQDAIRSFIASQAAARGAKHEATRELLKGVDLKTLDPRAAIDRAMARKTARGGKRPSRPLMKG